MVKIKSKNSTKTVTEKPAIIPTENPPGDGLSYGEKGVTSSYTLDTVAVQLSNDMNFDVNSININDSGMYNTNLSNPLHSVQPKNETELNVQNEQQCTEAPLSNINTNDTNGLSTKKGVMDKCTTGVSNAVGKESTDPAQIWEDAQKEIDGL